MFTVRKNSGILPPASSQPALGQRAWGLSPEGLSWNSGCPLRSVTMGTASKGKRVTALQEPAMRVHEKRCKRHDAADGSQQKQQACPLSLIDSNPTRPPAQWPAWTSQEEAPGPTSFTPRFCPQQRQDPFLGVGTSGRGGLQYPATPSCQHRGS